MLFADITRDGQSAQCWCSITILIHDSTFWQLTNWFIFLRCCSMISADTMMVKKRKKSPSFYLRAMTTDNSIAVCKTRKSISIQQHFHISWNSDLQQLLHCSRKVLMPVFLLSSEPGWVCSTILLLIFVVGRNEKFHSNCVRQTDRFVEELMKFFSLKFRMEFSTWILSILI